MEAIIITMLVCSTFIFLTIRVTNKSIKIHVRHDSDTTMNTNFKDNTPIPDLPVYKEMTKEEALKDAGEFETFAKTVNTGINKIMNGDDSDGLKVKE